MSRKLYLPLVIIGVLVFVLIFINVLLPRLSIPNLGPTETDMNEAPQKTVVNEVILTEEGFSPVSITIKKGETISFINQSGTTATVNSNPHPVHNLYRFINLGEFPDGTAVQAVFNEVGSFGYHNHYSPEQQGTIVVEE